MKICAAQCKPVKGNLQKNIENHLKWIQRAAPHKVDLIIFPELSLTGYEPTLAKDLTIDPKNALLKTLQIKSDKENMIVGVGLPTQSHLGVHISMLLFLPNQPIKIHSKQLLHPDEEPYFQPGEEQALLTANHIKMAPAICFESLQESHVQRAKKLGAGIYLASVAKSQQGVEKAYAHFSQVATKHNMTVLMANAIGYCDNFVSAGQSSIWNKAGRQTGRLSPQSEGILVYDTETGEIFKEEESQ